MPDLPLLGCTPEPLMGYLKALGVFRLVAEQADPATRMSWAGGICHLHTTLGRDGLIDFFLNRYRPTPVLAPWNGGGGFYGGGAEPLEAIANSSVSGLALYRDTIATIRQLIPTKTPKDEDKQRLLIRCRAELPDEVVPWLDTCFVLGEDGAGYFPLLGTGGNDGRLDFTNNFMQRLADVIVFTAGDPSPLASAGWLASALFADDPALTPFEKASVGQFNPGGIGGANGVQGSFEANSQVNPWDFVFMIEGALLFAGSVARRLGTNTGDRAAFPFTVNSVAVGYGSATASEETTDGSRAELWLPLWDESAGFGEVRQLFAEGRAQVGRKQAKNSVEFALAVNLLGVSRGVTAFARYGFLKRNGLAFLAAPLGRVAATSRPEAKLLDEPSLRDWLESLRKACRDKERTPARYQTALRGIDRAVFEYTTRAQTDQKGERSALLAVLRAIGRAERTLANGFRFTQENHIRPLQGLLHQWLKQADDESHEFALAAAIAGISLVRDSEIGSFRVYLEPVAFNRGRFEWDNGSTSAVWSNRPLAENLAAVFCRRQLEAFRTGRSGVPLRSGRYSQLSDVEAFLNEQIDDEKLTDLLWGLIGIDWLKIKPKKIEPVRANIPTEFGIPRLLVGAKFYKPKQIGERVRWRVSREAEANAKPDVDVFHALASGRDDAVQRCVDLAARRLKSGGLLVTGYRNSYRAGAPLTVTSPIRPARLLAAMLFPLSDRDLGRIANAVLYPPEPRSDTHAR